METKIKRDRKFGLPSSIETNPKLGCFMVLLMLLFLAVVVSIDYFSCASPFSPGLYKQALSGRVSSISQNRRKVSMRLTSSDLVYYFEPRSDPVWPGLSFSSFVRSGDTLWKKAMSDTLYTLDSNGYLHSWPFSTTNLSGKSFLTPEETMP